MSAIGRTRRNSSNMAKNSKSFQKKAIGGGIALALEYLLMDKVITTKNMAYLQTAAGLGLGFLAKNPTLKVAGYGVGALGAVKAFTGKNVVTQTAISGLQPFYISGTNPLYASTNGDTNFV